MQIDTAKWHKIGPIACGDLNALNDINMLALYGLIMEVYIYIYLHGLIKI